MINKKFIFAIAAIVILIVVIVICAAIAANPKQKDSADIYKSTNISMQKETPLYTREDCICQIGLQIT